MKSEYFRNAKNYPSHTLLKQHHLWSFLALKTISPLLTAHVIHSRLSGSWRGPLSLPAPVEWLSLWKGSAGTPHSTEEHESSSTSSFISINTGSTVPSLPLQHSYVTARSSSEYLHCCIITIMRKTCGVGKNLCSPNMWAKTRMLSTHL